MNLILTKSAFLHMRFLFSLFLLPVFVFALSQVATFDTSKTFLVFLIWHFFIYPASNGYNSYFDKDEGSIALLEKPPAIDKSLFNFSILLDLIGGVLSLLVSLEFFFATLVYGVLSKLYSHPSIRLKKYPVISFLVVFIFQGAFVYWTSYAAISGSSVFTEWNLSFFLAGIISSCLIGASYPLTQVYQHEEDSRRGDQTLSLLLGIKGSFVFAALLFTLATVLMYAYWHLKGNLLNFWLYLIFIIPVAAVFVNWFFEVMKDKRNANFRKMSTMTLVSGTAMLVYFSLIMILRSS